MGRGNDGSREPLPLWSEGGELDPAEGTRRVVAHLIETSAGLRRAADQRAAGADLSAEDSTEARMLADVERALAADVTLCLERMSAAAVGTSAALGYSRVLGILDAVISDHARLADEDDPPDEMGPTRQMELLDAIRPGYDRARLRRARQLRARVRRDLVGRLTLLLEEERGLRRIERLVGR